MLKINNSHHVVHSTWNKYFTIYSLLFSCWKLYILTVCQILDPIDYNYYYMRLLALYFCNWIASKIKEGSEKKGKGDVSMKVRELHRV